MGKSIDTMNHNQYHKYFQRTFHSIFTLQQDLLQTTTKMMIFLIILLQAARRCPNAVIWCSTSEEGLLCHKIIKNSRGRWEIQFLIRKWMLKMCQVFVYSSSSQCVRRMFFLSILWLVCNANNLVAMFIAWFQETDCVQVLWIVFLFCIFLV